MRVIFGSTPENTLKGAKFTFSAKSWLQVCNTDLWSYGGMHIRGWTRASKSYPEKAQNSLISTVGHLSHLYGSMQRQSDNPGDLRKRTRDLPHPEHLTIT